MIIYRFDFSPKIGITVRSVSCEERASTYRKLSGGRVNKDDMDKIHGPDLHMYSISSDSASFVEKLQKRFEDENKRYMKKIQENELQVKALSEFLDKQKES